LKRIGVKGLAQYDSEWIGKIGQKEAISILFKTHDEAYTGYNSIKNFIITQEEDNIIIISVEWNSGVPAIMSADNYQFTKK